MAALQKEQIAEIYAQFNLDPLTIEIFNKIQMDVINPVVNQLGISTISLEQFKKFPNQAGSKNKKLLQILQMGQKGIDSIIQSIIKVKPTNGGFGGTGNQKKKGLVDPNGWIKHIKSIGTELVKLKPQEVVDKSKKILEDKISAGGTKDITEFGTNEPDTEIFVLDKKPLSVAPVNAWDNIKSDKLVYEIDITLKDVPDILLINTPNSFGETYQWQVGKPVYAEEGSGETIIGYRQPTFAELERDYKASFELYKQDGGSGDNIENLKILKTQWELIKLEKDKLYVPPDPGYSGKEEFERRYGKPVKRWAPGSLKKSSGDEFLTPDDVRMIREMRSGFYGSHWKWEHYSGIPFGGAKMYLNKREARDFETIKRIAAGVFTEHEIKMGLKDDRRSYYGRRTVEDLIEELNSGSDDSDDESLGYYSAETNYEIPDFTVKTPNYDDESDDDMWIPQFKRGIFGRREEEKTQALISKYTRLGRGDLIRGMDTYDDDDIKMLKDKPPGIATLPEIITDKSQLIDFRSDSIIEEVSDEELYSASEEESEEDNFGGYENYTLEEILPLIINGELDIDDLPPKQLEEYMEYIKEDKEEIIEEEKEEEIIEPEKEEEVVVISDSDSSLSSDSEDEYKPFLSIPDSDDDDDKQKFWSMADINSDDDDDDKPEKTVGAKYLADKTVPMAGGPFASTSEIIVSEPKPTDEELFDGYFTDDSTDSMIDMKEKLLGNYIKYSGYNSKGMGYAPRPDGRKLFYAGLRIPGTWVGIFDGDTGKLVSEEYINDESDSSDVSSLEDESSGEEDFKDIELKPVTPLFNPFDLSGLTDSSDEDEPKVITTSLTSVQKIVKDIEKKLPKPFL
tara:strand:+ start:79 stop:2628 length:2550 start_codon:yes stop_codon:yes gene_type:complete